MASSISDSVRSDGVGGRGGRPEAVAGTAVVAAVGAPPSSVVEDLESEENAQLRDGPVRGGSVLSPLALMPGKSV